LYKPGVSISTVSLTGKHFKNTIMKLRTITSQLSLKKVTVAHLSKSQSLAVKGGNTNPQPTTTVSIPTQKSFLPESPCRLTIIQPGTLL